LWTGVVPVRSPRGKLSIAGGGVGRDPGKTTSIVGGIATLEEDGDWGTGRWWRR
jgi:hypothetical protein